jgi:hypothetical protein
MTVTKSLFEFGSSLRIHIKMRRPLPAQQRQPEHKTLEYKFLEEFEEEI